MSAPGQFVDPALSAFWASDPAILPTPDPLVPPAPVGTPPHGHHARLALELAAAFLICVKLARIDLGQRHEGDPRSIADGAWNKVRDVWLGFAGQALRENLSRGPLAGLVGSAALDNIATQYAASLGEYLGATSVDAFSNAVDRQLAGRWSERAAFVRAAEGFGLDERGYNAFLKHSSLLEGSELVSPAAQAIADAALIARAELIGDTEAYGATESAKVLVWQQLQRDGQLPANTMRRWINIEAEGDCAECRHLHEQEVALDEPFVMSSGVKLWAPQAHPNCRCHVKLTIPLEKAYNPNERRVPKGNPDGGHWTRLAVAPEPAVQDILDQMKEYTKGQEKEETKRAESAASASTAFAGPAPAMLQARGAVASTAFQPSLYGPAAAFAPKSAAAAFGPSAGHMFTPWNRGGTHTRRVVVFIPPGPKPTATMPTHYLWGDGYFDKYDEHMVGKRYTAGEAHDFLTKEYAPILASPWGALDRDMIVNGSLVKPREYHEALTIWDEALPTLSAAWKQALDEADRIAPQLTPDDIINITDMSGDPPARGETLLKKQIAAQAEHVAATADGDGEGYSLAYAYADYVTYYRPDLISPHMGRKVDEALTTAYERGMRIGAGPEESRAFRGPDSSDISALYDQVFVFDKGLHPSTPSGRDGAHVSGTYYVYHRRYRSAMRDFNGHPPIGFVGLSEAYVEPWVANPPGWDPPG